jgi:hypothetical protein
LVVQAPYEEGRREQETSGTVGGGRHGGVDAGLGECALAAPGAPTVVRTVLPDGATDVAVDPDIKAKFSEAMKARSINETTFYLIKGHFTYEYLNSGCGAGCIQYSESATVRYNDDTKTAILDPTAPLEYPNTEYTAVVDGSGDGDKQAVKDRGGTPLASDYIFYFTTGTECGASCE